MKILIVSKEVWRNDQNGGNTLTGLFSGFPEDTNYAQIFCSDGFPYNDICYNYYKLTTKSIAKVILKLRKEKSAGEILDVSNIEHNGVNCNNKGKPRNLFNSEYLRDLIWKSGYFKSEQLKDYILSYNPDIIFAPGYGVKYMSYLIQWIATFISCPIVSLISDDFYSMRQIRFSPFYWIDHIVFRNCYRKTAELYSLIYTMTETQKCLLERDFGKPVKIIHRGVNVPEILNDKAVNTPIKLVYAGNLYFNRWKTLEYVAKAIRNINEELGYKFQLDVYTNSQVRKKIVSKLNIENASRVHGTVSSEELKDIYNNSDITLHVESFDVINREKVRLSFSTKIVDCITSGCAVMCICDKNQGGYKYLEENDAAICINNNANIERKLRYILNMPQDILKYRKKAHILANEKHNYRYVSNIVYNDLKALQEK